MVPADAADWQVDPFSGHIGTAADVGAGGAERTTGIASPQSTGTSTSAGDEACVWGRGAVDMKDMDAMILAVVRQRLREGRRPPRDVVLAFLADEEAGGAYGARYLVDNHPGLFEGVTEAVGEVGGFSVTLGGQRLYLIQTAEKGMAWLKLTARGTAGHGSMLQPDNAVTELAETVARIGPSRMAGATHSGGRGLPGRGLHRARHRVRTGGLPSGHRQDRVAVPAHRRHPAQHP